MRGYYMSVLRYAVVQDVACDRQDFGLADHWRAITPRRSRGRTRRGVKEANRKATHRLVQGIGVFKDERAVAVSLKRLQPRQR